VKTVRVKIEQLTHPNENVRIHDENQIKEFIRSLDMFGQIRPAVIDDDNIILVGNGMIEAMRERGDIEVDVLKLENLSPAEKKKLMIVDNQIFNLGFDNDDVIGKFLEELQEVGDIDIPGFDISEVEEMLDEYHRETLPQVFNNSELSATDFDEDKYDTTCPRCGFIFNS